MSNLEVNNVYASGAKFVRFRLNKGWDYVWITYDDVKGFLSITSSYGNWSFIWSAMGEGTTLTDFIIRAGDDYLANKMWGRDQEMFEYDEAVKDIKQSIVEDRRSGHIEKSHARLLWKEAEELGENYEGVSRDLFMSAFSEFKYLSQWKVEWWETNWGMRPKPSFLTLKTKIIPMFRGYLEGKYDGMVEKAPFSV